MPRKKRPLDRDGGALRDARLVVIASEDTLAVRDYFSRFRLRRVQFRILPTEGGRSAPQHVVSGTPFAGSTSYLIASTWLVAQVETPVVPLAPAKTPKMGIPLTFASRCCELTD
jgi:hypothetical protein